MENNIEEMANQTKRHCLTESGETSFGEIHKRVQPKNSMDRFEDNLCQLILSYLKFKDKVRLESVSTKWQRLVYNKTFVLKYRRPTHLDNCSFRVYKEHIDWKFKSSGYEAKAFDKLSLQKILKKCHNIEKVYFYVYSYDNELELIGQYCPHLKALVAKPCYMEQKSFLYFSWKYGRKIEELVLGDVESGKSFREFMKKFLKLFPNLKRLDIRKIDPIYQKMTLCHNK